MLAVIIVIFTLSVFTVGDMKGIHPLIFGGKHVAIEEAPFMAVYAQQSSEYWGLCGASILSERYLLTAAHCYHGTHHKTKRIRYYVYVGTNKLAEGQRYSIEKNIIHPKYNDTSIDYDVLVIKLRRKLVYSARIQPIKMADAKLVIKEGTVLETFGFGLTEKGYSSTYLLKVRVPYIDREKCKAIYEDNITDRMICAGREGKDSCAGDSGGPLVHGNVLVGVVSFGVECGGRDYPGVYASVSSVRSFIDYTINKM